jgi:hypothetical protein
MLIRIRGGASRPGPPLGPDDQQASLGHAIAWTLVMGAAIATARMIAIRYTSRLLGARQSMTETAAAQFADHPAAPRPKTPGS